MTETEAKKEIKQARIEDWKRLFLSQTDPDRMAEARREAERKKRAETKKKDTGL